MARTDEWHSYKGAKEAWVTGQTGSSVMQINLVCTTALASYALWLWLPRKAQSSLIWEYVVLVVPLTLACTILAESVYLLLGSMLLVTLGLWASRDANASGASSATTTGRPRWAFLTVYRAYLLILTIYCILAVDFPIFPRIFAKCETFGTSLVRRYIPI